MKEELLKKARKLEAFAEIIDLLENNIKYYQHVDDETGELVDDTGEWSEAHLAAYRETLKAVRKIVGL